MPRIRLIFVLMSQMRSHKRHIEEQISERQADLDAMEHGFRSLLSEKKLKRSTRLGSISGKPQLLPTDMVPLSRKLGFHDHVLERRLLEVDQLLDTDVDYLNRDGINAKSLVQVCVQDVFVSLTWDRVIGCW